ncbi:MAG: WG repeat-containing protein [Saprospiraceae bacterium]
MRLLCCFLLTTFINIAFAQTYFPVKVNQKWGLIDQSGQTIVSPDYDAIGDFYQYGYAIVQEAGKVGVMNKSGEIVIKVAYKDLQVLDSTLFAVIQKNRWTIIDLNEKTVLNDDYERVKIWQKSFLFFSKNGKWGLVDISGKLLISPLYDNIKPFEEGYFITELNGKKGLVSASGQVILSPVVEEIRLEQKGVFFYKKNKKWGAVDSEGTQVLKHEWDSYQKIDRYFYEVIEGGKVSLYSITQKKIITQKQYDGFLSFSKDNVIFIKNRHAGLLNENGREILKGIYEEIQPYGKGFFRVKKSDFWGIVGVNDKLIIPFEYEYIAPLKKEVCVIRQNNKYGIANVAGELVVKAEYDKIELKDNIARAFKRKQLTLLTFDTEGKLKAESQMGRHAAIRIGRKAPRIDINARRRRGETTEEQDYVLDKFEWFFSTLENKWGLRSLETGDIQIKPTFKGVEVRKDLGFTLVYIKRFHKTKVGQTSFRFENLYGLVNNEVGLLVTDLNIWDIRLSDFEEKKLPTARCIFNNGKHGIIRKDGKILKKDYTYIGEFVDGLARASARGNLSGDYNIENHLGKVSDYVEKIKSPGMMVDYTIYDNKFLEEGMMTCESCDWGFIDTMGVTKISEDYQFVNDFVNDISIVKKGGKWGYINKGNKKLIGFEYDAIRFLENTDQKILRLYVNQTRYGLIDTLGKAIISVTYDNVGEEREGLIPVEKNGRWGYTDLDGKLVIPCQYERANSFYNGVAAVKKNRKWGFINSSNKVMIDFKFKAIGNFNGDLAWFKEKYKYGYLNEIGQVIIPAQFEGAKDFEGNVARVRINEDWGLIDRSGTIIMKPKYNMIGSLNQHGIAIVQLRNNHYSFINELGERITNKRFEKVSPFSEGYAAVEYRNLWGFIDTMGKLAIAPKFSRVKLFQSSRASVRLGSKWGFIDTKGQWIIEPQFSKCLSFKDGKAVVYKGYRNSGLIDLNGNYIIEPSIHRMLDFNDGRGLVRDGNYRFYFITENNRLYKGYYQNAEAFQDGVAAVQQSGKWGLINDQGIEIIPPKYDKVETFNNGFAKVRISQFSGAANIKGELIAPPSYEYISYAGNGIFRVEEGDKIGYFDAKGNWIWELKH